MDWLINNLRLRLFTWLKVPLIAYLRPEIVELNDRRCVLRLPLFRRSRNHLNVMYMGALCVGAECTVGVIAIKQIQDRRLRISVVQREFSAEFLDRADGDVHFVCEDVPAVLELIRRAEQSSDRVEGPIRVTATVPSTKGSAAVARFSCTLSLKSKR
jgi:acyl-coenzyme A thioesterase PaaI-like protein